MKYFQKLFFLVFIMFFFVNFLFAGWVITEKTTNSLGTSSSQTTFIQNNKVRYENETSVVIFDLNTNKLIMIFPQYKVYWEGTAKEFNESTNAAFESHLQQIIATSSGDTKQIYQKMYDDFKKQINSKNDSLLADVQIKATGNTDTILNYPAKEYLMIVDDSAQEHLWVTTAVNPYDEIDYKKMINFTRAINPYDKQSAITASEAYIKLISKGMILKSVEKHNGIKVVTQVTMVKHVNFDNSIFTPPKYYLKTGISEIMQMQPADQHLDPAELQNNNDNDGFPQLK